MPWFTKKITSISDADKRAYRHALLHVTLQLRSQKAWWDIPMNLDDWRTMHAWGQTMSRLASWGHDIATYSAEDFAGFEAKFFWPTPPVDPGHEWWFKKHSAQLSTTEQRPYRLIIANTLLIISRKFSITEPKPEDPGAWIGLRERVRVASDLANWLHNLAEFSVHDFVGFDAGHFWDESIYLSGEAVYVQDITVVTNHFTADGGILPELRKPRVMSGL